MRARLPHNYRMTLASSAIGFLKDSHPEVPKQVASTRLGAQLMRGR